MKYADRTDVTLILQPHPFEADGRTIEHVEPGTTLGELLRERTPPATLEKYLWTVRVNGKPLERDQVDGYVPKPGDHVACRVIPKDPVTVGAAIIAAVGSTTSAAVLSYGAIATVGGIAITVGGIASFVVGVAALAGVNYLASKLLGPKPPKQTNTRSTASAFYSLGSTRNEVRKGAALQSHFGTIRVVPDMLMPPIGSISADGKVSVRYVYCVGEGQYDLDDIRLAKTPISTFNPKTIQTYLGTGSIPSVTLSRFSDNIFDVSVNLTLKDEVGGSIKQVRATQPDSIGFNILAAFDRGYYRVGKNGKNGPVIIQVRCDYRIANTSDPWTLFYLENFRGEAYDPVGVTITSPTLPANSYEVRLYIHQVDGNGLYDRQQGGNGNTTVRVSDLNWLSLQSRLEGTPFNDEALRNSTIFGIELQASEVLSGALDEVNVLVSRKVPYYDGADWRDHAPTSNPAWCMTDKLLERVAEEEIDAAEFLRFANYCDAQGWYFNHTFVDAGEITIREAMQMMAQVGQASYVKRGSLHSVALDEFKTTPTAIFTGDKIHNLKTQRVDVSPLHGVICAFVNEDADYQVDERKIFLPGYNENNATELQELPFTPGITNKDQLFRHVMRELARRELRSRVYSFTDATFEGLTVTKGDLVELCHERALRGLRELRVVGSTNDGTYLVTVTVDRPVLMEAGREYGLRVSKITGAPFSLGLVNPLTAGSQTFTVLTVDPSTHLIPTYVDDFSITQTDPMEDNFAAFGDIGEETIDLLITDVLYDERMFASFKAVDYAPAVQTADSIPIPEFVSVTGRIASHENSSPPTPVISDVSTIRVGQTEHGVPIFDVVVKLVAGAPSLGDAATTYYRLQHRQQPDDDGVEPDYRTEPVVEATIGQVVVRNVVGHQTLDLRAFSVSNYGSLSAPAESTFSTLADVPAPSNVVFTQGVRTDPVLGTRPTLVITWEFDPAEDASETLLRYRRFGGEWVEAEPIIGATTYTIVDVSPGDYEVELRGRKFREVGDITTRYVTVFAPENLPSTGRPTGLELLIGGERQGNSREFTGRSATFIWNPINSDDSLDQYEGLDEAPPDNHLVEWLIKVEDPTTLETIREKRQPISENRFTYDYDSHLEDGLRRSIRLEVQSVDRSGNVSLPAIIVVSNNAPATPEDVTITSPAPGAVVITATLPADPDLDRLLVWASTSSGFTPSTANLVASGPSGSNTASYFTDEGLTLYFRVAWSDAYSQDPNDLNVSDEIGPFTTSESTPVPPELFYAIGGAYSNVFDRADDIDDIYQGTYGTAAPSVDSFSGPLAALFSYDDVAPSENADDTPYLQIPARIALGLSGQRVRVKVWAKQPSTSASSTFRLALSQDQDGTPTSSGWQSFNPTTTYLPYEFLYQVPTITQPTSMKLRIHGDAANAGNGVLIDNVQINPIIEQVDGTNKDVHLGSGIITTPKLVDSAVTGLKIAALTVTDAKIANAAITNAKIGDLQVSTVKIQDNAVTVPVGAYTAGSITAVATGTTVQSVSLDSLGQPISIVGSCTYGDIASGGTSIRFQIKRDGTTIYDSNLLMDPGPGNTLPFSAGVQDTPASGTRTYTLVATPDVGTSSITNRAMLAIGTKK